MKIGLVAMNGIRMGDQKLLGVAQKSQGLMARITALSSLPNLALLTLAGMTSSKHQVEYIEVPDLAKMETVPSQFDLVGITSYTAQITEAYELSRRFRELGVKVVMGGSHVTCLPMESAEHCDAVAIGEGESIWTAIIEDAEKGKLQKFYGNRASTFDLKDAPMPAFELLDSVATKRVTVQTSRGCSHRCNFCASTGVILTRKYKQKPINKVIREIDNIKQLWKRPFIEFVDDNAFVDKSYWKALLPLLKSRQVKWFAESDISIADDVELLDMLFESGCAELLIGLESPTATALDGIEINNNWKLRMFPEYREAIHKIQSRGIRVIGCFVLGLDGHDTRTAERLIEFADELALLDLQITVQTAFPGTPLYDHLNSEGRILKENDWSQCTLFDVNIQPTGMSAGQLQLALQSLTEKLHSQAAEQRRRCDFKKSWQGVKYRKPHNEEALHD